MPSISYDNYNFYAAHDCHVTIIHYHMHNSNVHINFISLKMAAIDQSNLFMWIMILLSVGLNQILVIQLFNRVLVVGSLNLYTPIKLLPGNVMAIFIVEVIGQKLIVHYVITMMRILISH